MPQLERRWMGGAREQEQQAALCTVSPSLSLSLSLSLTEGPICAVQAALGSVFQVTLPSSDPILDPQCGPPVWIPGGWFSGPPSSDPGPQTPFWS
jgi:hypothetical protein